MKYEMNPIMYAIHWWAYQTPVVAYCIVLGMCFITYVSVRAIKVNERKRIRRYMTSDNFAKYLRELNNTTKKGK